MQPHPTARWGRTGLRKEVPSCERAQTTASGVTLRRRATCVQCGHRLVTHASRRGSLRRLPRALSTPQRRSGKSGNTNGRQLGRACRVWDRDAPSYPPVTLGCRFGGGGSGGVRAMIVWRGRGSDGGGRRWVVGAGGGWWCRWWSRSALAGRWSVGPVRLRVEGGRWAPCCSGWKVVAGAGASLGGRCSLGPALFRGTGFSLRPVPAPTISQRVQCSAMPRPRSGSAAAGVCRAGRRRARRRRGRSVPLRGRRGSCHRALPAGRAPAGKRATVARASSRRWAGVLLLRKRSTVARAWSCIAGAAPLSPGGRLRLGSAPLVRACSRCQAGCFRWGSALPLRGRAPASRAPRACHRAVAAGRVCSRRGGAPPMRGVLPLHRHGVVAAVRVARRGSFRCGSALRVRGALPLLGRHAVAAGRVAGRSAPPPLRGHRAGCRRARRWAGVVVLRGRRSAGVVVLRGRRCAGTAPVAAGRVAGRSAPPPLRGHRAGCRRARRSAGVVVLRARRSAGVVVLRGRRSAGVVVLRGRRCVGGVALCAAGSRRRVCSTWA